MDKIIIDRFEGRYAVCEGEDKSSSLIPKYKLPIDCKEGDCLYLDNHGIYQKDIAATIKAEKQISRKMKHLFK